MNAPIKPLVYNTSANPHFLCAIDPGKRICGLSIWSVSMIGNASGFHAEMVWAGKVESPSGNPADMAYLVISESVSQVSVWGAAQTFFVLEVPQKYSTQRVTHSGVGALDDVLDEIQKRVGKQVLGTYRPRTWKGNLPKKIHHARLKGALTPAEHALIHNADHNVWDAIGIGLFATGRTRRGGVIYR